MIKKLFKSSIFSIIFLLCICTDLVYSIMRVMEDYETLSVEIFRYLNLISCLVAFASFFIVTKYSLKILRFYILKVIALPGSILVDAGYTFVIYFASKYDFEHYVITFASLLLGVGLYYFFMKYKVE